MPPLKFAALAAALLDRAHHLVAQWLPGGDQRGHEWVCGSLQGGKGSSTSVNLSNGRWADFATGEQGGDLLGLYAAIHGLSMGKAALQVAREEGLESVAGVVRGGPPGPAPAPRPTPAPTVKPKEDEGWRAVWPVPAVAPQPTFRHHARRAEDILHTAEYRTGDDLAGYVVRFATSDGGKETLPYTWCVSARDGAARWHWKTWDEPRPLYFPGHALPAGRTVLLVEGEKKADSLQALLDAGAPGVYCVASWPGGCKAWKKAGWAPLAGCTVLAWADCDAKREPLTPAERKATPDKAAQQVLLQAKPLLPADQQPGMLAMLGIGALLRDAHGCTVQLLPIPEPGAVPDGWDCGDAIDKDGWTFEQVQALLARAYALPVLATAEKIDGPTGVESGEVAGSAGGAGSVGGSGGAGSNDGGEGGGGRPWWLQPFWDDDKGRWLVSRKLVIKALQHDEALAGVLGLNLLSNNIEAQRAWPWLHGKAGPITGATDLMLGKYLSDTYGLPSINRAALMEAVETVAHENPFHPVVDYLRGLKHDGVSRIDKWLLWVIGETPQSLPAPMVEYLCLVGRFLLLGMVNRVLEPGCKFDYCAVLEGPGGLGKSTLAKTLASSGWFSDTHFDVGKGKDGQEQVQGLWVYEIAELSNFGKAEIGLIKAFISSEKDRYRPSYGRVVETFPRQCVLMGTTNEKTYLRDRTGNRRFWPVPVRQPIRMEWLRKWRDQLFAEAYDLALQGATYYPDRELEERLFVPVQESRLQDTAVLSELLHVLTRPPGVTGIAAEVNELADFVTLGKLTLALGVDAAKSNAGLEGQIRAWMEHEGWERVKRQVNGVRHWGWVRPRDWPRNEDDEAAQAARSTGGQPTTQGDDDEPF